MRIAQIGPLWEQIPPTGYGGTERVLYNLTEGLVKKGHVVTLFSSGNSKTSAKLVSIVEKTLVEMNYPWTGLSYPLLNIVEAFDRHQNFDVLHMHLNKTSDFIALPLTKSYGIKNKVVFTLHYPYPYDRPGYEDRALVLQKFKDLQYISISNAARLGGENLNWIGTVYNGIDISHFTFNSTPNSPSKPYTLHPTPYFLWLGKFNPDKGVVNAIKAAKLAGVKLVLVGKVDPLEKADYEYFKKEVEPHIDNDQVLYIGEKGGKEKDEVFGNAVGFLNPIQWNEPFGLVMTESQATGTPVISFRKGAAPELIKDGETGFIVDTVEQMVEKIKEIPSLNRLNARKNVEDYFTSEKMVEEYEKLYQKLS